MANLVDNPYPIFTDTNGDPLEDGYIFIGEPGLNPISNPLQAYWDAALTVPAVNIRTKGGYPSNVGTPGRLYTATNYSIIVRDKRGVTQYTQLDSVDYFNSASGSAISSVDTIAELRGIVPAEPYVQVSLAGSAAVGDGLMGPLYYWNPDSSAVDNGVSIIKPTAVTGNGRWLWINTNAPIEVVDIDASGTLTLAFKNRIFLVDTALDITLAVPDGDFQGQLIQIANRGPGTLDITGSGITGDSSISESASLTWLGTQWGVTYRGTLKISGDLSVSGEVTVGTNLIVGTDLDVTGETHTTTITDGGTGNGVSIQEANGTQVLTKIIPIGPWDMNATSSVLIDYDLDYSKVRGHYVQIQNDAESALYNISSASQLVYPGVSGESSIGNRVNISRTAGSFFALSTNFDSSSINRGWITITYIA